MKKLLSVFMMKLLLDVGVVIVFNDEVVFFYLIVVLDEVVVVHDVEVVCVL